MIRRAVLLLVFVIAAPAWAGKLEVAAWGSNSMLIDKEKAITYAADLMGDGKAGGMWVEGEGSAGLGKFVEAKFNGTVELARVRIWGGCFATEEFWKRHNRIKEIELKFADFSSERVTIEDKMEPQWITLKAPKQVDSVKIYLRAVYNGSTWNDTAISEMDFWDSKGGDGSVSGMKGTASSVYNGEKDYDGAKAVDGWLDTWWVEGGADGAGENVSVDLGGSKTLRRFAITTGADQTDTAWKASNRAARVTLRFDDGSTQSFRLQDRVGLQTFDLKSIATRSVKVTIDEVLVGGSRNELSIGEIRFWE